MRKLTALEKEKMKLPNLTTMTIEKMKKMKLFWKLFINYLFQDDIHQLCCKLK